MRTLARLALRFRTVAMLVVALIIVVGVVAAGRLEQELFPSIQPPFLVVTAVDPGAAPSQIADDLAEPIEEVVRGSSDPEHVQSSSQEGFAVVFAEYRYGTDIAEREREVQGGLEDAELPETASAPEVSSVTPDSLPIYSLALTSDDLEQAREIAADELVGELRSVEGIAEATVSGASAPIVEVRLDPQELAERGLTVADVAAALTAADRSAPVGSVVDGETSLPVRVTDELDGIDAVADVEVPLPVAPVGMAAGPGSAPADPAAGQTATLPPATGEVAPRTVAISELGEVEPAATPPRETISRFDGQPAVTLDLYKSQDANTVATVAAAERTIEAADLPADVDTHVVVNQAPEISQSVSDVTRDAVLGGLLAILMIVAFLRSWRGTIVAGVSIPLSLLAALAAMQVTDLSLNILTLGALAVAAGRVIDDAIVVLENIYRNLELGLSRADAVRQGVSEVTGAITSATLTAIAVFVPLAFISGIVGEVFLGFALTTAFALFASLVVASTIVPVLGSLLLTRREAERADPDNSLVRRGVRAPLRWALAHRGVTVGLALLALVGGVASLQTVPVNLFPTDEADTVLAEVSAPPGTSITRTSELVGALDGEIRDLDGVEATTTTIGGGVSGGGVALSGGGGGDNAGTITVELAEGADAEALRAAIEDRLARTRLQGSVSEQSVIPGGTQVAVQVRGDAFDDVETAADQVEAALADVDGLTNLTSNVAETRPELTVQVDSDAAAEAGLGGEALTGLLRASLNPVPTTTVSVDGNQRDVVARVAPSAVDSVDDLESLALPGGLVLGDIADVERQASPTGITRYDGRRSAEVGATIVAENIGQVTTEVEAALDGLDLPDGVSVAQTGTNQQVGEGFSDIFLAMAIAVALVYLVLVATFGSLATPLVVLVSLPLAAIGAFLALAATGRELGLPAMIGLLMLIGIVVTNAIVLLDFVEQLREGGRSTRDALLEGAEMRVRPILMTALTTMIGLVPLALGLSEGALLSASLATVVIGGLATSTVLTLIVVPVVYSLVATLRGRLTRTAA